MRERPSATRKVALRWRDCARQALRLTKSEPDDKSARLSSIAQRVAICRLCPHLASSRTQTVFGVGNPKAELMFIGEAPGADEDRQGEPFARSRGPAAHQDHRGDGLHAATTFIIANVLKCRPDMPAGEPGNRRPTPAEMADVPPLSD